MAHHFNNSTYERLADRLNRFPQGAPESKLLFDILKMLFSEEEAGLVAHLPIKPFTAATAARLWQMPEAKARNILENLASRAMLLDMEQEGGQMYCLPPPMAGFFEFSLMRVRQDIDQKTLSELYYQYINQEEDFMKALFVDGETSLGRIFVQEAALERSEAIVGNKLEVLDYERATQVIEDSPHIGISLCYCRHKNSHVGKACDAPQDICMTFNSAARSLIKHGHAREVSKAECRDLLQKAWDHHLVQFGENNRTGVNFICNCCGCCCEALLAIQRFGITRTIHSNFILSINNEKCTGCGKCLRRCPVKALSRSGPNLPPVLNEDICLGCGVCLSACRSQCLSLCPRPERTITPLNTTHRVVLMAAERGKLQELIFDNKLLLSHRLMGALVGSVLKLPPVARNLARKQLKSRYVEKLLENM